MDSEKELRERMQKVRLLLRQLIDELHGTMSPREVQKRLNRILEASHGRYSLPVRRDIEKAEKIAKRVREHMPFT